MIWKFDGGGFDFQSVQLSGIQPEPVSYTHLDVYKRQKQIISGMTAGAVKG